MRRVKDLRRDPGANAVVVAVVRCDSALVDYALAVASIVSFDH